MSSSSPRNMKPPEKKKETVRLTADNHKSEFYRHFNPFFRKSAVSSDAIGNALNNLQQAFFKNRIYDPALLSDIANRLFILSANQTEFLKLIKNYCDDNNFDGFFDALIQSTPKEEDQKTILIKRKESTKLWDEKSLDLRQSWSKVIDPLVLKHKELEQIPAIIGKINQLQINQASAGFTGTEELNNAFQQSKSEMDMIYKLIAEILRVYDMVKHGGPNNAAFHGIIQALSPISQIRTLADTKELNEKIKAVLKKNEKKVTDELKKIAQVVAKRKTSDEHKESQFIYQEAILYLEKWLQLFRPKSEGLFSKKNVFNQIYEKILQEKQQTKPDWVQLYRYLQLNFAIPETYKHFTETLSIRPILTTPEGQQQFLLSTLATLSTSKEVGNFAATVTEMITPKNKKDELVKLVFDEVVYRKGSP